MNLHILPDFLAIEWDEGNNTTIEYKKLRLACPCAHCKGETDVFGNVYMGEGIKKSDLAFEINKIELVGHYAIRIYWQDNHNSGIYPFKLLQKLDDDSKN